jgi:hypothetical protein
MKINLQNLVEHISQKTEDFKPHLSVRIESVLSMLIEEDFKKKSEVDIFELIVWVILRADHDSASCISSLMVPITAESMDSLDRWAISNASAFVRDFLMRDQIKYTLRTS